MDLSGLDERISRIEKRNKEVELNTSWEISWTRKILLSIFTYLSIALYLKFIVNIDPWVNAIVPAIGFLLSTLTLPYFKTLWERWVYKKI